MALSISAAVVLATAACRTATADTVQLTRRLPT